MFPFAHAAALNPTGTEAQDAMGENELKVELLQDLGAMIAREVELDDLLDTIARRIAGALRADRATIWMLDSASDELRSRVANYLEVGELRLPVGKGVAGFVAKVGETVNIADVKTDQRWAAEFDKQTGYHTTSMLCVPIADRSRRIRGVVQVLNKRTGTFNGEDEQFLHALADQIARALDYTTLRPSDSPRGVPMRGPFNHIVGASEVMRTVYERVMRAAATDATVLLRGETGTGKGLFARAIHVNSQRRDGPLVQVDGTNLPAALVESELFGHERGAYTGADKRVVGKVEVAEGGTLFLDELGEIPLELQGKLLRFLQEKQFERVGGRETIESNVRIVAATNRDLEDLVKKNQFRSDLYYRVRVIEIVMPPLRARGREDILNLADHFLAMYAKRYAKPQLKFGKAALDALAHHQWPGNVRELEHAVERAVVLAPAAEIDSDALGLVDLDGGATPKAAVDLDDESVALPRGLTLDEATRAYAEACVKRHDGNQSAAARELGISRNTLARLLKEKATG